MEHVCFPLNMQESNQIERRQRNQGEKNKSYCLVVEKKNHEKNKKGKYWNVVYEKKKPLI